MNNRYRISCLFNNLKIDESTYNRFLYIYENSNFNNEELNINELTKLTKNKQISTKIINIYNNNFKILNT